MAGIFRVHNKFHRSSHHTLSSARTQDQGLDPIASSKEPFNGIFYNNLTDQRRSYNIKTNSFEWYSTYATVYSLSSNWDSIKTTYATVNSLSSDWQLGYSAYQTLNPLSSNYNSAYTDVNANSAIWSDPNLLYTNRAQENTKSKTFRGYDLSIESDDTVNWDLDIAQVAFLVLDRDIVLKNPITGTQKKGGLYTLYIKQDETDGGWHVDFEASYKFPISTLSNEIINYSLSGITVINFISDGSIMFGDFYQINEPDSNIWLDMVGISDNIWDDPLTAPLGGISWVD